MNTEKMRRSLESAGLNLFSILASATIDEPGVPDNSESLLLIGSAGVDLWKKMPVSFLDRENPIDEYSRQRVAEILQRELPGEDCRILFPAASLSDPLPSLQKLGEIAGWHSPSPLGLGINEQFGLWFAYRAVVSVARPLTASRLDERPSPCVSCVEKPCVSSCPASAITFGRHPDLKSCVQFRAKSASPCAERCLSRLGCPVATQWRYSQEQLSYFYRRSLPTLVKWVAQESEPGQVPE